MAIWAGEEQESFQAVIDGFEEKYPNVSVKYTSGGDNLAPLLSTAVEGGNPPTSPRSASPGLMADFAEQGAIKPIDELRGKIEDELRRGRGGRGRGRRHAVRRHVKGTNKSTVWYNVAAFEEAGVEPPETWDELIQVRDTIKAAGITPYSVGVDVGWPITDLFENIYIRSAGPEKYDQLAKHEIPWTDQSVKDALTIMKDVVGDSRTTWPAAPTERCRRRCRTRSPRCSPTTRRPRWSSSATSPRASPRRRSSPRRATTSSTSRRSRAREPSVVGGGDLFVKFKDSPAADAFLEYLTTTEAAEIWAKLGGFSSPNKNLDWSVYPDEITRTTAGALAEAETFRFDLSDLQPAAFGGTPGQGLFKALHGLRRRIRTTSTRSRSRWRRQQPKAYSRRMSVEAQTAEAPSGASARAYSGSLWERYGVAAASSRRRSSSSAVWIVYPTISTIIRSFYDREGDNFVGVDNYETLFTDDTLLTAIRNNFLWLLIVPAFVTAIGLVFAVLLERVRFSIAFKVAVFMPMAISLFAAGVIWRLMYEKDPDQGTVNAAVAVVKDAVSPSGVLSNARPSTEALQVGPREGSCSRTRSSRATWRSSA